MAIARVFPRKTKASPTDDMAFFDKPSLFEFGKDISEVHVSVAFSYDMQKAEMLVKDWKMLGVPVKIGGPALNDKGGAFVPGMYIKTGYVITSRGCPNRCFFCSVWKREGDIVRELPINDGYIILDDNLLACSDDHIKAVFAMLKRQPNRAKFTGGLEAARLQPWHINLMKDINPETVFFAYDTPDDYEPLIHAGKMLKEADICGVNNRRCYVLVGYQGDSFDKAESRLLQSVEAGFFPMAMLFRDEKGIVSDDWRRFQRSWANPTIIACNIKKIKRR